MHADGYEPAWTLYNRRVRASERGLQRVLRVEGAQHVSPTVSQRKGDGPKIVLDELGAKSRRPVEPSSSGGLFLSSPTSTTIFPRPRNLLSLLSTLFSSQSA